MDYVIWRVFSDHDAYVVVRSYYTCCSIRLGNTACGYTLTLGPGECDQSWISRPALVSNYLHRNHLWHAPKPLGKEKVLWSYRKDNILKGGYDAFYISHMLLLKGEGCRGRWNEGCRGQHMVLQWHWKWRLREWSKWMKSTLKNLGGWWNGKGWNKHTQLWGLLS